MKKIEFEDALVVEPAKVGVLDELPIGVEIDYDGDKVPEGWEEIDDPNNYSTEEQVIGEWMGKPLYRKTITTTKSFGIEAQLEIAHGAQNVDKIWLDTSNSYIFQTTSKTCLPIISTSYWGDFAKGLSAMVYANIVILYTSEGSWGSDWEKVFTICYTKTTD